MPKISFLTKDGGTVEVPEAREGLKLLAVAVRNKLDIRFGCSSCRCGTCAVELISGNLSEMDADEKSLLEKIGILNEGHIRLSCKARVQDNDATVDLNFQEKYDTSDYGFS